MVANDVYRSYGSDMMITAINNGKHMPGSLHYVGQAADLRVWYGVDCGGLPPGQWEKATETIKSRLPGFDVILESNHIHVEYDPK